MDFDTYQKESRQKAVYPEIGNNFVFPTLGLVGEAGEVAEKIKKLIRDKNTATSETVTSEDRAEIQKELGDVLWYLAQLASEFKLSLTDVAQTNLNKIASRHDRGVVHGDGDNR
ncbi:nucleoside triphosphate pyrophosphohydrolase family protein [Patescibacteria group bacterium]|nr:nucleoside triphosphate pyrophosphohydrolase family protein [Patescibacteria group bacterium]